MLRHVSACVAVILVVVCASTAPAISRVSAQETLTGDELVARNLKAKGGLDKWKAIETVKQVAIAEAQGARADVTLYGKRPNMQRQETLVQGQLIVNGFDGTTAWFLSPQFGADPIPISGVQAQIIKDQSDFDGPLVNYKDKNSIVELVGREMTNGVATFHLKLTRHNTAAPGAADFVDHVYLDATTYLETRVASDVNMGGMTMKMETDFADYRAVDGITMPFSIKTRSNGIVATEMTMQSVQFNVKLDDTFFRMPVKVK